MYIARHACKQHKAIAEAEPSARAWVQAKSGVGQPCRWCGLIYKQRAKAHQRACPVFWTCGHLLSLYYNLHPTGQTTKSSLRMTTQDELELQRARRELSQFEAYNPSSKILQSSPPSTAAPSQTDCTKPWTPRRRTSELRTRSWPHRSPSTPRLQERERGQSRTRDCQDHPQQPVPNATPLANRTGAILQEAASSHSGGSRTKPGLTQTFANW